MSFNFRTRQKPVERCVSRRRWKPNQTWHWFTWSTCSATLQHERKSWLLVRGHWSSSIQFWETGGYAGYHSLLFHCFRSLIQYTVSICVFLLRGINLFYAFPLWHVNQCDICLNSQCCTLTSAPPQKTLKVPVWRRHSKCSCTTAVSVHICNIVWVSRPALVTFGLFLLIPLFTCIYPVAQHRF